MKQILEILKAPLQWWDDGLPLLGSTIRRSAEETKWVPVYDKHGQVVPNKVQRVINDEEAIEAMFSNPEDRKETARKISRVHEIRDASDPAALANEVMEDVAFITRAAAKTIHKQFRNVEKIEKIEQARGKLVEENGEESIPAKRNSGSKGSSTKVKPAAAVSGKGSTTKIDPALPSTQGSAVPA